MRLLEALQKFFFCGFYFFEVHFLFVFESFWALLFDPFLIAVGGLKHSLCLGEASAGYFVLLLALFSNQHLTLALHVLVNLRFELKLLKFDHSFID